MIVFSLVLAMMSGHKIKASEPLKIEKFEVEKSEVRCGEKIKLNIEISGAHKTYTIYEEDINGTKKTIVDNSYSSSFNLDTYRSRSKNTLFRSRRHEWQYCNSIKRG